jgi:hypothetical protein
VIQSFFHQESNDPIGIEDKIGTCCPLISDHPVGAFAESAVLFTQESWRSLTSRGQSAEASAREHGHSRRTLPWRPWPWASRHLVGRWDQRPGLETERARCSPLWK